MLDFLRMDLFSIQVQRSGAYSMTLLIHTRVEAPFLGTIISLVVLLAHLPFLNEFVQPNIFTKELKSLTAIRPSHVIPISKASLRDLDQAVPFAIGFIILAFSIRGSLRERAQQAGEAVAAKSDPIELERVH
jgi:hypothetical protein